MGSLSSVERARLFDEIWQTVNNHYLYPDFHGVNWQRSQHVFRPQAMAASSDAAFYKVLEAMIGALNDQHSRFVSPEAAAEERAISRGEEAYVGVGIVCVVEGRQGIVTHVFEDSPGAKAGLRRRDRVHAVDGVPYYRAMGMLRGLPDSSVSLRVQSPGEQVRTVVLSRQPVVARFVPRAYRLPTTNTGYLLIPSLWAETMDQAVKDELAALFRNEPLDGLIIDLRGNSGGWRSVLEGILGVFAEGEVGTWVNHGRRVSLHITPSGLQSRLEKVPLVVLVDRFTESYAEVLAATLQWSGRAQIVGTRTPGNTETIYPYDFADGSRLWIAQEGFTLPTGFALEDRGVMPDMVVTKAWADFSEANDPYIMEAGRLLSKRMDQ